MPAGVRTTVVVVTWRGRGLIGPCLDALAAQTRPHRVLVVDNASTDGTAQEIAGHLVEPQVLRLARNAGYAGALAAALPQISTPFMAWLNDDAQPEPGWLAALEQALDNDDSAAAAASVLHTGVGTVTSIGVALTAIGYGRDTTSAAPFGFCGGAALLHTGALRAAGGVPASLFCYYEDTDTSWRLRLAGYQVLAVPGARVRHIGGASARHGTPAFHRWNERNRLLVLLRCAPASVAARELARFAALTLLLPWRRHHPGTPNFTLPLRLRVLTDVAARLPTTLIARHRIGRRATVPRAAVWSTWAGNPDPHFLREVR
ncbi:MAG: glycosyl transferase [Pseudonocardiales bacterium]|nr:glycosyltransferase [Actinomycetota bacterium]PZS23581.1 MAG: glycosyl transferase [Pseudonocardiales bacterium]